MSDGTGGWAGIGYGDWTDLAGIRARLDAGADPDAEVWAYQRPLHVAAEEGSPEVVAELARRVADVDAEHEGRSALWNAVYHGRPDNARVLVAAGADPWRPMMRGWSPGRLSLLGPEPELFGDPGRDPGLTVEEAVVVAVAPQARRVFDGFLLDGLGLACVAGVDAGEAVRRLGGAPAAVDLDGLDPFGDEALEIVGVTEVPGGCVIAQPWGYAPQRTDLMKRLSRGTVAYGLYANPKSGNQGCVFRDGEAESWGLNPGGGHPFPDEPSLEILTGYLTRDGAVAHCCAFVGLHPSDTRPVEGPPDLWIRLPAER
ncbi:hypothetical protein GCM10009678_33070 [Actinomadura kijaniata]|uniref:Ankyrin repeat domain-containing protein n=1 Tax=Actinomadura namibiensis TaxID=182080 RepID=A0A7W3QKX3_ACTNM|nr:ankyrin repeat domain-containing protein [Actinomadura namibiensis]MBA8950984.1 hypothetical protein [Actinomadura namibiensis]